MVGESVEGIKKRSINCVLGHFSFMHLDSKTSVVKRSMENFSPEDDVAEET